MSPAVRRLLRATRLLGPARALKAALVAARAARANAAIRKAGAPDGLPLPSGRLVFLVAGTPDLGWFLRAGREAADSIRDALAEQGVEIASLRSILDFGCGCGRVLRHWSGAPAAVHGCDYNRAAVRWCRRHLPFARVAVNRLAPPLPYGDAVFDLVYALSVFTHLPEALQRPWLAELARVVRPGGHALVSVHGRRYLAELTPEEQARFEAGTLVVRGGEDAGTNLCAAYHPAPALRAVVSGLFDVAAWIPEGARGNPHQDLVVLRRPAGG
jgi:SAM-dependent methyltransferase